MSETAAAMLRDDWWWPWWVSSLIDLAVAALGAAAFMVSRRRAVRLTAAVLVLTGLIAAVLAPVVMSDGSDAPSMDMNP